VSISQEKIRRGLAALSLLVSKGCVKVVLFRVPQTLLALCGAGSKVGRE
jgi:hypothetical protein